MMTQPLATAPQPAREIPVNFMWNACVRYWHKTARKLETQFPGWSVRYTDQGFFAQEPGGDLLGPATWGGIEAQMRMVSQ